MGTLEKLEQSRGRGGSGQEEKNPIQCRLNFATFIVALAKPLLYSALPHESEIPSTSDVLEMPPLANLLMERTFCVM